MACTTSEEVVCEGVEAYLAQELLLLTSKLVVAQAIEPHLRLGARYGDLAFLVMRERRLEIHVVKDGYVVCGVAAHFVVDACDTWSARYGRTLVGRRRGSRGALD